MGGSKNLGCDHTRDRNATAHCLRTINTTVMAEGPAERNEVLKSLEEEVKCPLCLDIFTEPKRLPCEHVFCAHCLLVLTRRAIGGALSCPVCCKQTPLQDFDVNQFPTAFQVNRFIEMYRKALKQQTATAPPEIPQLATCTLHSSQSLALYCETCKKLVCRDCALFSCSKHNHEYGFLEDMAKKCKAELDKDLQPIRVLHQNMSTALQAIKTADQKLERRKEEEMQRVEASFDALFSILRQEKGHITAAIETQFGEQFANNTSKKKELCKAIAELAILMQSAENMSSKEHFPVIRKEVTKKKQEVKHFLSQFTELSLYPIEVPEFKIEVLSSEDLEELCRKNNHSFQRHNSFDLTTFHSMKLYQPFKVNLDIKLHPQNSKIKSKLVCTYDNTFQLVTLSQLSLEKFQLSVTPQKRGRHELHVQHNDIHICGSPISSYVYVDPQQITALGKPLRKKLQNPSGVKCYDDKLYVVEPRNGITVLSQSMDVLQKTVLLGVYEIMIHNNLIYYTDIAKAEVVKSDMSGRTLASIGGHGTWPGLFNHPNGIRLSDQDEIYVCDSRNHRIQVFSVDFMPRRTIGSYGISREHFDFPCDLDFDEDGNIYVVELYNNRVQVLTPQGQHIRYIGIEQEKLNAPVSAAIHNNTIYITESRNKHVSIFTIAGEFVTTFGEGVLSKPECIAIDRDGFIFVTDNQSKIFRF